MKGPAIDTMLDQQVSALSAATCCLGEVKRTMRRILGVIWPSDEHLVGFGEMRSIYRSWRLLLPRIHKFTLSGPSGAHNLDPRQISWQVRGRSRRGAGGAARRRKVFGIAQALLSSSHPAH